MSWMLELLGDGRRAMTPAEARWCEASRRVLGDGALLERLERAEVTISQAQGAVVAEVIRACLADNGVDVRDPAVGAGVARRLREVGGGDKR